jgi:hypothetical protein
MKIISDINPNKHVQGNIHFSEDFYIFSRTSSLIIIIFLRYRLTPI